MIISITLVALIVSVLTNAAYNKQKEKSCLAEKEEKEKVLELKKNTEDDFAQKATKETNSQDDESQIAEPLTLDKEILIAIDPGHQASEVDMSALEPNAPDSSVMKAKCTTGTSGKYSGLPEFQLNMDISLQLRDELERRGYQVLLVRENNQTAISNAERAVKASDAGADVYIRIHANGDSDANVQGALAIISTKNNPYVGHLYDESYKLAADILKGYLAETKFQDRGVIETDTMTGINWSKIPVMIMEMGFMSNQHDDVKMADSKFQKKMVKGLADGIDIYYGQ